MGYAQEEDAPGQMCWIVRSLEPALQSALHLPVTWYAATPRAVTLW